MIDYYSSIKKEQNLGFCDNIDGPRGYYAKRNKSDRERQISYDFTYILNLRNQINEQTKLNINRLICTKNKLEVTRGEEHGG